MEPMTDEELEAIQASLQDHIDELMGKLIGAYDGEGPERRYQETIQEMRMLLAYSRGPRIGDMVVWLDEWDPFG